MVCLFGVSPHGDGRVSPCIALQMWRHLLINTAIMQRHLHAASNKTLKAGVRNIENNQMPPSIILFTIFTENKPINKTCPGNSATYIADNCNCWLPSELLILVGYPDKARQCFTFPFPKTRPVEEREPSAQWPNAVYTAHDCPQLCYLFIHLFCPCGK